MDFNLAVILRESARRAPAKTAVILGETRLSYAQLDELLDWVAAGLTGAGSGFSCRTSRSSSSPTSASSRPAASWCR